MDTLESESNTSTNWFTKNKMISPDKFQVFMINRKKSNITNIRLAIDNKTIRSVPSLHISNICRSAAN